MAESLTYSFDVVRTCWTGRCLPTPALESVPYQALDLLCLPAESSLLVVDLLRYPLKMPSHQNGSNAQMHVGVAHDHGDQININATNVNYSTGGLNNWSHIASSSIACQREILQLL